MPAVIKTMTSAPIITVMAKTMIGERPFLMGSPTPKVKVLKLIEIHYFISCTKILPKKGRWKKNYGRKNYKKYA